MNAFFTMLRALYPFLQEYGLFNIDIAGFIRRNRLTTYIVGMCIVLLILSSYGIDQAQSRLYENLKLAASLEKAKEDKAKLEVQLDIAKKSCTANTTTAALTSDEPEIESYLERRGELK